MGDSRKGGDRPRKNESLRIVSEFFETLSSNDMVIAPINPSEDMKIAGAQAATSAGMPVSIAVAGTIYTAMLGAVE